MVLLCAFTARAGDIVIHLDGAATVSRQVIRYQCDAQAPQLGLPSGAFPVEYINGGGNSLAIVPLSGKATIFVNILSGSGARYAAGQYIWWEAGGRGVTLTRDTIAGKTETTCRRIPGEPSQGKDHLLYF
jgi:membrane-bound inhibitor of C-type lysozyme